MHTYITLHYITLHYITLHYTTLHYIALHCIALHCIALHCIALHYIHTYKPIQEALHPDFQYAPRFQVIERAKRPSITTKLYPDNVAGVSIPVFKMNYDATKAGRGAEII